MHEAYTLCPSSKLSVQIESIAAYDNHVILGTRSGQLLMYSVSQNEISNKVELQLLKFNKSFSKKPITQIEVVPEENLLFSLSDGLLNVCDISRLNFSLIHSAVKTKGANIFCLDVKHSKSLTGETAIVIRVCVAIKRKLQFFYWKHDKILELQVNIELSEIPKALCWSQDIICVGFKTEYVIYDISEEPKKYDLCLTSSSRIMDPCICLLNDEIFGVAKDEYLIAIDPKDFIKKDDKAEIQKKSAEKLIVPSGTESKKPLKPLTWSQPVLSLVWDEPYAIGLTTNGMEVRSLDASGINKDTLVQTIADLNKARLIVRSRRGSLFAASFSELWYIHAVDIPKQRQNLLLQKRFQLALDLTKISEESEEEKNSKIHQIQTLFAFELFANKQFAEAMQVFAKLKTDPCDVIRLFPDLLPQDNQKGVAIQSSAHNIPPLEDKDLENGLLALIDYLIEVRRYLQNELQKSSESKSFGKKTPLLSIIDTTLLKCYLQTNDSLVAPLLRLNHCHLEESEKTLKKHQKFGELIILYQIKGQHKRALDLLRSQANVAGSGLFGHDRTIQYLQHMGKEHKDLIFEFSDWVLKKYPEDGLKIFTEDFTEVENLPRAEVLDYLLKNHKSLVIPYLEHIIHVWGEHKPMFHNILIQQYREKAQSLSDELVSQHGAESQKRVSLENIRSKLLDFLEKSTKYNPETVLSDFPTNSLFEERAVILGRLKKHEKVLAIHIQILGNIEKAAEYCERNYPEEKDIFAIFIKTLLTPPTAPPYSGVELHPLCLKPDNEIILDLLNKYAAKINPAKILPYLSDDIPLVRLKPFLEVVLRTNLERRRQNQVLKGLLYAEDLQMQEQRMHYEMKNVFITDFTVCPVCKKKFTNQSAFVRYPTGEIVHFSCQDRK